MTLTLSQRIEEGDTAMQRSISVETEESFDLEQMSHRIVALLQTVTWSTPPKA